MCNSFSIKLSRVKKVEIKDVPTCLQVPFQPVVEEEEATIPTTTLKKVRFALVEDEGFTTPPPEQAHVRRYPIDRMTPNTPPMQPLLSLSRRSSSDDDERIEEFGPRKTRSFLGAGSPRNKKNTTETTTRQSSTHDMMRMTNRKSFRRISYPHCGGRFDTNTPPVQPLRVPRRSSV